ncbi:MAG TPA: protein kinase [Acidimicrobiales bacterium]|nr:protein kinase [Acidimicrobiales bacterium]
MPIISEPLGRVLGNRYRLVAALGSGAAAHVFLAEDVVLQRRVAVKVLQPALARDDAFLHRFRAEARSVAALNHPHVLRVFDWGEGEDGPYLVLEYLEGGSLFDMLVRGRRLSPAQAARIGAQAADGLAYAHARGIVHRDVKPANLLFDEEGRVRVADFGVARALSSASTTDPGTMLGTARYASPEQAQGLQLDGRSDVYSLGLVLYEGVTGTVPFAGDTPHATLQARIGGALPEDPALGPLGPHLAAACAPDAQDRPAAAELAERLEGLADDLAHDDPLPLVQRGEVDGSDADGAGVTVVNDAVAPAPVDLTLAGPTAAAAGLGAAGLAAARLMPGAGSTNGGGLADAGEPTATIKVGDGVPPAVTVHSLRRHRQPRRWPWVVAVLVLLAAILTGAGIYIAKKHLLTPSHPVPSVVGDTMASARRALRAEHFKVQVEPAVTSIKVGATKIVSQVPSSGVSRKEGSTIRITPSSGKPSVTVPQLSSSDDCSVARQLLAEKHLRVRCPALSAYSSTIPKGNVINWSYNGKLDPTTAPYGALILVAVSEGRQPVQLPTFKNQSYAQASATLSADGLTVREVQAYSTSVASGNVISTTPGAGATVPVPNTVTVTVSNGPQNVPVPTVIGDTVSKAASALQAAGFTLGKVYGPATGVVFTTDPLAGQKERIGSSVILYTETPPPTGHGPKSHTGTPPATRKPPSG